MLWIDSTILDVYQQDKAGEGLLRSSLGGRSVLVIGGEEYLDSEEAARLLGVKRETLYAYVSRGLLRSYRQGIKRQRLYRRRDVEELLRLAPASGEPLVQRSSRRPAGWEIPLAESWVRD